MPEWMPMVGTPDAAAICFGPLSQPMNKVQAASSRGISRNAVNPGHRADDVRPIQMLHDRGGNREIVGAADQQHGDAILPDQQFDQCPHMFFGPLLHDVAGAGMDGDHRTIEQMAHVVWQFLDRHGDGFRIEQRPLRPACRIDRDGQVHQIVGNMAALALQRLVALPLQNDVQPRKRFQRIVAGQHARAGAQQQMPGGKMLAQIDRDVETIRCEASRERLEIRVGQLLVAQFGSGMKEFERDAGVDRGLDRGDRGRSGRHQRGKPGVRERCFNRRIAGSEVMKSPMWSTLTTRIAFTRSRSISGWPG